MKPRFTIADGEFLPYGKSESLGGDNTGIGPTYFDWEPADPQTARFVTDRYIKDARGTGQVAWLSETFMLHPENYLEAMKKPFDAVLTHNRYFAQNLGWLWFPHGGSWIDFNLWGMHEKTKDVSLILSDKNSLPGHKLRHEVAKHFGDRLDIFGLPERTRKFDCLAPYRYSIVIESERCAGFFSEKLIDCISVGTIPIYWGCPNIGEFLVDNGVFSFEGIQDLDYILSSLLSGKDSEVIYQNQERNIYNNISFAKNYRISEDWIYTHYPELFGGQT